MKQNRLLGAGIALAAVAALSLAALPGGTLAKYAAAATAAARAGVAKWDAFENGDYYDDPVTLVFEKTDPQARTATFKLVNNSEVTARYTLRADVDSVKSMSKQDFLAVVQGSIEANYVGGGIVIPFGQASPTLVTVTVPVATFKGLTIRATAVQVD